VNNDVLAILFVILPFVFLFTVSYLFRKWVKRNTNKKAFKAYNSVFDVQPFFNFIGRYISRGLDMLLLKLFFNKKQFQ